MSEIEYRFTTRPLTEDEGGGCMSDGETIEGAIPNREDGKRWIAAMKEANRPVQLSSVEPAEPYSGKWQLSASKWLHRRIAERAKREGGSLNALAVRLLAEGLAERSAHGNWRSG